jgi:hypothetical protein
MTERHAGRNRPDYCAMITVDCAIFIVSMSIAWLAHHMLVVAIWATFSFWGIYVALYETYEAKHDISTA